MRELPSGTSRRMLPAPGDLDALAEHERCTLVTLWAGRAEAELQVSDGFRTVAQALRHLGAEPQLKETAERAIADEERHSRICHHVACIFAGQELAPPPVSRARFPDFSRAPPALVPTLQVVTLSCFSETTGSAFLETCLQGTTDPLIRAVLLELLGDDIDHARLGWAYLHSARMSAENRLGLADFIAPITRATVRAWRRRPRFHSSSGLTARGCPPWEAIDRAVVLAIRTLIFPGFERAGYRVSAVSGWFDRYVLPTVEAQ